MNFASMSPAQRREKKRRWRANRYRKGLTATGTPVRFPEISNSRRLFGPHHDCRCYDCLFVHTTLASGARVATVSA